MTHLLAIDQGTTSSRAILFDAAGAIVASAQKEFTQHFPRPGWVEHDADEIWSTQAGVITEAIGRADIDPKSIAALGIANQRETTLVWDRRTGRPIAPAIVWQDRRTASHCERLKAGGAEPLVQARSGLVLDAYFSGTKLAWILDNAQHARQRAEAGELAFGTIDTWLAYRLSGRTLHVTDASNASRTLLYNIHEHRWDDDLLALFNIPRAVLPDIVPTSGVVGEVSCGLAIDGLPIAALAGDQQAATMGQLCTRPGLAKNTYGTGCFLLMNTGDTPQASTNRLLTTVAWRTATETAYALEGSVFVAGAIVQWLRDGLKIIRRSEDIEPLARSVPDAGGVALVPALAGLGAPHWDPHARGAIFGLTRGTTDAHIARAALEGIACDVAGLVRAMQHDAGRSITELRVDGGASANDLLMQIQADTLGVPVVRPAITETTALGAAYLAGLATGVWSSPGEIESNRKADRRFEPQMPDSERAALNARWNEAIRRTAGWARPESDA